MLNKAFMFGHAFDGIRLCCLLSSMICILSPVAQSVVRPIADPGVVSWIPAGFHTFVEIDHEIFSTVNTSSSS